MSNQYPRGKLCEDDDGALAIKIAVQEKTVLIDFGKPVKWIGLAKQDAENLAAMLLEKAKQI